jgi:aryl-alcohol dehydrogenase-like predicted oxidoreductase
MSEDPKTLTRRDAIRIGLGASVALGISRLPKLPQAAHQAGALIQRPIPSSGERLPIVGIGTARNYENPASAEALAPLREVLRRFPELGGRVLDTAPAYGRAESVVGDLLVELKNRDQYFLATKVSSRSGDSAAAAAQMEESLKRLRTDHVDLMQVWNLSSPDVLLPLINEWKDAKRVRYMGVTTSNRGQYDQLETLMKKYKLDFIQVDLSIDNRTSQDRLLPLAAERGIAVLVNLPFGRSRVFERVRGKPLPDWARDLDVTSWPQLFLKYIVGHPAVTTVIPGTEKVEYLVDNLGAARGRLPDAAARKRIESYYDGL